MLVGKARAYVLTGSAAILSDAAESVIHVVAVAFAAFTPAPQREAGRRSGSRTATSASRSSRRGSRARSSSWRPSRSSARPSTSGFTGCRFERLGTGTLHRAGRGLARERRRSGWYLVRTGRRTKSIILEANGRHVLTDCWTSFGVVGGLCLVLLTGWLPFDPIMAIAVALEHPVVGRRSSCRGRWAA